MPSSNGTSPIKRPTPNQRSVSSYAVPTRQAPSVTSDLSQSHKAPAHKHFRPHVVGAQRTHARNPSYNKSLNKPQKLTAAHNLTADGTSTTASNPRNHQDRKSAQTAVATSPRGQAHVRWNGSTGSLTGQTSHTSIRKNFSSPALRRNGTTALGKKIHTLGRPPPVLTGERKKTVGFELVDSDEDDEWEDNSSHSPESTRRNSMAATKINLEHNPPSDTSAGNQPTSKSNHSPKSDNKDLTRTNEHMPSAHQQQSHHLEHDAITSRLLSRPRSSKAPPAMSSVSATASSPVVDRVQRGPSFTNIASRRNFRTSNIPPTAPNSVGAPTPGANPQGTSSSIEGGVSRFLDNDDNIHVGSRSGSDPNTPSSFLPHYHLQSSPSSNQSSNIKKNKSRTGEPHSRTQQKLWLQRTATLATSPPDPAMAGLSATIPPSAIEPVFRAVAHSRSGSQVYNTDSNRHRGGANGGVGGGMPNGGDAKHVRKVDERLVSELFVVRRFRTPALDSLSRIDTVACATSSNGQTQTTERQDHGPRNLSSNTGNKSAPTLTNDHSLQTYQNNRRGASKAHSSDTGVNQFITKNNHHSTSHVHFHDQDDMVNIGEPASEPFSESPDHNQPLSMGGGADGAIDDDDTQGMEPGKNGKVRDSIPRESDMLIRRLWDSREIGVAGD